MDVPGSIWMVDLPGDGSNTSLPGDISNTSLPAPLRQPWGGVSSSTNTSNDPYAQWPQVLLEAALALPNAIYIGHSTGGMYLLSVPELEQHIAGLVLISSAPDASWHPHYVEMTKRHPLPEVDLAAKRYESEPTNDNLRDLAVASAPWNFTPKGITIGRDLLSRMPYNQDAVAWSDKAFDHIYQAKWWPKTLPTLILSGAEDNIVLQTLWNRPEFKQPNVSHQWIESAGHFPWLENPDSCLSAFTTLTAAANKLI
jgi:pimeloyl-ACP methyl ester carboxylesterase